ncbi:MAG TPA: hypothetical protein VK464_10670 [Symbiobacteriaceae bacterium]|jgi:hypothetical protein|nr:hypothetical protein [Symbiobacteriaceae bacterium]
MTGPGDGVLGQLPGALREDVRFRSLWGGWVAHQAGDLLIDSLLH